MKYLVTGAAGFIGSHLVLELASRGHEVVAVDALLDTTYTSETKRKRWEVLKKTSGIHFIEKNLTEGPLDEILEQVDIIINEAAMPGLMKSWADIKMYSDSNLVVVGEILKSLRNMPKKRFIQISTSSVYGKNAVGNEKEETNPYSPYGVTKLAAEKLIAAHNSNYELDSVILRYFSVYGPGQRPDMGYSIFIDKMLNDSEISIFGDGKQTRSNTYIEDCIRGTILAAEHAKSGETYNLSGDESKSLLETLEIISDEIGNKPKLKFLPARPGDQISTKGDWSKAHRHFGYEPTTKLDFGLRTQVKTSINGTFFNQ